MLNDFEKHSLSTVVSLPHFLGIAFFFGLFQSENLN